MSIISLPKPRPRNEPFERGDHVELATRLISALRSEAPVTFTDGKLYQYQPARGIHEPVDHPRLSQIVQGFAGVPVEAKKGKALELRATDIGGAIKLAGDQVSDVDYFAVAPRGVAFADTFAEVTAERIVRNAHSPDHRARFAYPFPLVAAPNPVRLHAFFAEVFRDDADADDKVRLIQEYFGASLIGLATTFQRVVVFLGDGANGKGVLSKIAEACFPSGSVCSIAPQDLGQEYRRHALAGRLLNLVSELPEAEIMDSESWKAIVAGDTVTGREIRQSPFSFRPVAGHVYSANRLPGTTDQTLGFWRRILVMNWGRVFEPWEQRPRLAEEIVATEKAEIVAWFLEGAQRLQERGQFTVPASSAQALEKWKAMADQVRAFVDAWTTRLPIDAPVSTGTSGEQTYKAYRRWAAENGHRPLASNSFGERMRLVGLASKSDGRVRRHPISLTVGDES